MIRSKLGPLVSPMQTPDGNVESNTITLDITDTGMIDTEGNAKYSRKATSLSHPQTKMKTREKTMNNFQNFKFPQHQELKIHKKLKQTDLF